MYVFVPSSGVSYHFADRGSSYVLHAAQPSCWERKHTYHGTLREAFGTVHGTAVPEQFRPHEKP